MRMKANKVVLYPPDKLGLGDVLTATELSENFFDDVLSSAG
jgi:hypothetical protein